MREILLELFDLLDREGVRYCILHGWQSLPEHLRSDLDLIIAPEDLERLEKALRKFTGRVVQLLPYKSTGFRFDIAVGNGHRLSYIPLDVATDYRWDGRIYFAAKELLRDRQQRNGFWVAAPKVEFAYLLVKKVSKDTLPDYQKERLQVLHGSLGKEAHSITRRLFGTRWGEQTIDWIARSDWSAFDAHRPTLKRLLRWQVVRRDPLNPLRYWIPELGRIWRRWSSPMGLFVVVLGPDGAGKSTLIHHLRETLAGAFRKTAVFHLRPSLFGRKEGNGPVTDPHGKPPYSWWLSLLKIPYYLLDYGLGYLFKVRPRLVRSTLVLFDRYYDDLLVDPRRYRYGGPAWLARLARTFIPKPDLFLILDAREEPLLARKQEISREEIGRQREAYQQLAAKLPVAVLLDGSLPPELVARNTSEAIVDFLHERYLKRRHVRSRNGNSETLNWLTSVLSSSPERSWFAISSDVPGNSETRWQAKDPFGRLTLRGGREYLIPLHSRLAAVNALGIYNAQSIKAKLAKEFLSIGLKLGVAQPFLHKARLVVQKNGSENGMNNVLLLDHLKKALGCQDLSFAISVGTPGPYHKPVLQLLNHGEKTMGFVKVGWNDTTNALVQHEAQVLEGLAKAPLISFSVPRVLSAGWWNGRYVCVQSSAETTAKSSTRDITHEYMEVLSDLSALHTCWIPLRESEFWKRLLRQNGVVFNAYYQHLLEQGIHKVEEWLGDRPLPFHFCHGDLAPWNVQRLRGRLFLFDWEYSDPEAPPGRDLFHFIVQSLGLLEKRTPGQICKSVLKGDMENQWIRVYLESVNLEEDTLRSLFLLYLLERLAFYASEENTSFHTLQPFAMQANLCLYGEKV